MPDEEHPKTNHNAADVLIEGINALRDIFNDWRAILLVAIVVLMVANKVTGSLVFQGLGDLVRAWKCQP